MTQSVPTLSRVGSSVQTQSSQYALPSQCNSLHPTQPSLFHAGQRSPGQSLRSGCSSLLPIDPAKSVPCRSQSWPVNTAEWLQTFPSNRPSQVCSSPFSAVLASQYCGVGAVLSIQSTQPSLFQAGQRSPGQSLRSGCSSLHPIDPAKSVPGRSAQPWPASVGQSVRLSVRSCPVNPATPAPAQFSLPSQSGLSGQCSPVGLAPASISLSGQFSSSRSSLFPRVVRPNPVRSQFGGSLARGGRSVQSDPQPGRSSPVCSAPARLRRSYPVEYGAVRWSCLISQVQSSPVESSPASPVLTRISQSRPVQLILPSPSSQSSQQKLFNSVQSSPVESSPVESSQSSQSSQSSRD